MKINKHLTLMAAALLMLGLTSACQKTTETNKNTTNQPAANSANAENKGNSNQAPINKPEANKTETDKSSGPSLATPTDAYKAAYAAREKKDIEGLKKILSVDAIDFFTEMGKDEGKSLDDVLKKLCESPQAKTAETRNEKIDGNKATLEFLDEKGNWSPMDFIKDGNDWKLTIPKFDEEPPKANNTNKKPI